jgi:Holliday junction resolvasome RuvABC endonuclease subunit
MVQSISELINEYHPEAVFVEGVIWKGNAYRTIMLAQLAGMIIGYCTALNLRVGQLPANVWRKTIGFPVSNKIKREEYKRMAVRYIKDKYGIIASDDEAESICINIAARIIDERK